MHEHGRRGVIAVAAVIVTATVAAALGALEVVGGELSDAWTAARDPDLLAEPRLVAGLVAAAGVLAGGLALALTVLASLLRPRATHDEEALLARIERSLSGSQIAALEDHVVACGAEELVRTLADELGRRGVATVVLERDAARAQRARLFLSHVIEGDPARDETLRRAGIERAAALALCSVPRRERARIALAADAADPEVAVAAIHDQAGARAFAEALIGGTAGRAPTSAY